MVVGAVLSLCLALFFAGSGLWTLTRRSGVDVTGQVLRAVAPTQIAAAVMLAAGGLAALAAPAPIVAIAPTVPMSNPVNPIGAGAAKAASPPAASITAAAI